MDVLALLRDGELVVDGQLVVASNVTLVGRVIRGAHSLRCVYKPISGERPLWDFPDGTLAAREVAAYEISRAGGWGLVPPTVLRPDGPLGPGMCQLWVEEVAGSARLVDVVPEPPPGWLPILRAVDDDGAPVVLVHADDPRLLRLAVFDLVVNNADRKAGHVLTAGSDDGGVVGVDHGVCFHVEPKLRTVLWGWAGRPIPEPERGVLRGTRTGLDGALARRLSALVAGDEVAAVAARIDRLLADSVMPHPTGRMPVPWPVW